MFHEFPFRFGGFDWKLRAYLVRSIGHDQSVRFLYLQYRVLSNPPTKYAIIWIVVEQLRVTFENCQSKNVPPYIQIRGSTWKWCSHWFIIFSWLVANVTVFYIHSHSNWVSSTFNIWCLQLCGDILYFPSSKEGFANSWTEGTFPRSVHRATHEIGLT